MTHFKCEEERYSDGFMSGSTPTNICICKFSKIFARIDQEKKEKGRNSQHILDEKEGILWLISSERSSG